MDTLFAGQYDDRPPPYFAWGAKDDMRVSDDRVLGGVVFIGAVGDGRNFTPLGTGFIVVRMHEGFMFQNVITARHVIEDIDGDRVYVRANLKEGGTEIFYARKLDWRFHPNVPNGHYIDVAVMPSTIPVDKFAIEHMKIEDMLLDDKIIREQNIGVGDDVNIVGLFTNHYGEDKNIPVVRSGTIAQMPQEPMRTEFGFMDGYLVEARSLGGLSGSPAFVQMTPWHITSDGQPMMRRGKVWYFIGLMCGHWLVQNPEDAVAIPAGSRETGNINTGIGIVVPASKIMEVIDQPELKNRRDEIVEAEKKKAKKTFTFDSAISKPSTDKIRDGILRTMLGTPPQPRIRSAKKRVKRK